MILAAFSSSKQLHLWKHRVTLNAWPQSTDHRSDYFLPSGHWQCNASWMARQATASTSFQVLHCRLWGCESSAAPIYKTADCSCNGYASSVVLYFLANYSNSLLSTSITPFFGHWITCKENWLWESIEISWMSPEAFSTDPNKVSNSYIDSKMYYQDFLKRSWQTTSSFSQDAIVKEDVVFCQFDIKCSLSFSAQMQKFTP